MIKSQLQNAKIFLKSAFNKHKQAQSLLGQKIDQH